jgi:hypothetical protein
VFADKSTSSSWLKIIRKSAMNGSLLPDLVSNAGQILDDFSRVTMAKNTIITTTEKKAFFNRHQAQWIRSTGTNTS